MNSEFDEPTDESVAGSTFLSTDELSALFDFGTKLKQAAEQAVSQATEGAIGLYPIDLDCLTTKEAIESLDEANYFVVEGIISFPEGTGLPWLIFIEEKDAMSFGGFTEEGPAPAEVIEAISSKIRRVGSVIADGACKILKSKTKVQEITISSVALKPAAQANLLDLDEEAEVARITHKLDLGGGQTCRVRTFLPREVIGYFRGTQMKRGRTDHGFAAESLEQTDSGQARMAQFMPLPASNKVNQVKGIDLILDVSLKISVELGRARLPIREVLELGPGSIVELDKLAGEPVDILANDRIIARGEVVVVDENFGVRITDIMASRDANNNNRLPAPQGSKVSAGEME